MINYIEKGIGLHLAIAAAGHVLYQEDGQWITDNEEAVQRIIDEYVEPLPVPEQVTMRQARVALISLGLLDDVEAALASIPDEQERKAALVTWEYSSAVERFNPLIVMLAPALSLTEEQVDDVFRLAASL